MKSSSRKTYQTLSGQEFDLDLLSPEEQTVLKEVRKYYETSPPWGEFSDFWLRESQKLWEGKDRRKTARSPLFKIFQDMGSRLGIKQGYVRKEDYRDRLLEIIEENFVSWYRFCQETGVDEGFLSRILHKKRHFSMETLSQVLDKLGYEITFRKKHQRYNN